MEFFSICFRLLRPVLTKQVASEESGAKEIIDKLEEVNETIKSNKKETTDGLNSIKKALSDDNDNSLTGQLQRIRGAVADLDNTNKEGFKEQIKEFKAFSEHISKHFQKQ